MTTQKSSIDDRIAECKEELARWRRARVRKYGAQTTTLLERAWAAGLFDGEGTAAVQPGKGVYCELTQVSDDLINLVRFREAVGVGVIDKPRDRSLNDPKRRNHRPTQKWRVTSQQDAELVFAAIGDFLNPAKMNGSRTSRKWSTDSALDGFARVIARPIAAALRKERSLPNGVRAVDVSPRSRNRK